MSDYRVWECQICGWTYDEAKGWPEDGIAPGTRWDDIPEDWSCPECGAAKQDFAMVEITTPQAKQQATGEAPAPTPPTPEKQSTPASTSYRIWECMVCGWVYDESKGSPEDGIAPFTRWEEIPDDWSCPQCGVGKEEFDMVLVAEVKPEPTPSTDIVDTTMDENHTPLVIIGSGLAGYNLAREFRKLDPNTPLTIVSGDDGAFYSKPLLSASLAHGKTPQQLASASAEDMAQELQADILVHTRVTAIDPSTHTLTVTNGDHSAQLHYRKLVLATGAACRPLPPMKGDGHAHLFRINSLSDYNRFRTALAGGAAGRKRVLLMGAGLIGCEFANDLIQAGCEVEMVDPLDWPLASLLPEAAGRDLQRSLEERGVRFHGNTSVTSLERDSSVASGGIRAQLSSGESLNADIALAALGLQPNTALAEAAGLEVARGIAVNRQLQTSDADIFALGDCAEVDGHLLYFIAPLMACARALAKTLSGTPTDVHYGVLPVAVKTTLRPTTICPPRAGAEGDWQIEASESGVQAEFRSPDGHLLGFVLTGSAIVARNQLAKECAPLMEV